MDRGLEAQAGPAPLGLAHGQGLFCSPGTGAAKAGSWGNMTHTRNFEGHGAQGGGDEDGSSEDPGAGRLGARTAGTHIPAPPLAVPGCDLGSARASLLPSVKRGCEDHLHYPIRPPDSWVL